MKSPINGIVVHLEYTTRLYTKVGHVKTNTPSLTLNLNLTKSFANVSSETNDPVLRCVESLDPLQLDTVPRGTKEWSAEVEGYYSSGGVK